MSPIFVTLNIYIVIILITIFTSFNRHVIYTRPLFLYYITLQTLSKTIFITLCNPATTHPNSPRELLNILVLAHSQRWITKLEEIQTPAIFPVLPFISLYIQICCIWRKPLDIINVYWQPVSHTVYIRPSSHQPYPL